MGAYASTSIPNDCNNIIQDSIEFESKIMSNILRHSPQSNVLSIIKQINRYDSCGIGYSRIKSENYALAERMWELCNPFELGNIACSHCLPHVRLYAFEGLCVLLKTMKNFGHSPYWRFRFQPTESNIQELEDILFCTLMHLQTDHSTTSSMNGCTINQCEVSSTVKSLGWDLLPFNRQQLLDDIILQTFPNSSDSEQILCKRAKTQPSLETYLLLERQLKTKPYLIRYLALFKKNRDKELIISYLKHNNIEYIKEGIKAVSVWPDSNFWSVISQLHLDICNKLQNNVLTLNNETLLLFFSIHEAIIAFPQSKSVKSLTLSYHSIYNSLNDKNPRLLSATLHGFYNVIPIKVEFGDLLYIMWERHNFINAPVLELLLDISGEEKKLLMDRWYSFLMGTHPRLGKDSPIQILSNNIDALDLIFNEIISIRKQSIQLLSNISNPVWSSNTNNHLDKPLFCLAMSVLMTESNNIIICKVMEHCIKNCTCHDASFICEYAAQIKNPSDELLQVLYNTITHWNFYVHDPAIMALLCYNKKHIDKKLEEILNQPITSLSVYKPVTEGCLNGERKWRSFM